MIYALLPGLGNQCASSWRDARRARCQLNDALWTRARLGITLLRTRRTQHHPLSAASKHPVDAGPSWGPQSMMRHLAGLRWQSQRRRRRPSGQRRPSTKPSRGRAWVTHTAPKQPSLPSAEDERAAWGPPAAAAARTMPMLRNAFQPFVTQMLSYTSRMSLYAFTGQGPNFYACPLPFYALWRGTQLSAQCSHRP